MDAAAITMMIAAITGSVLGIVTLIVNRKTSRITSRIDDTGTAFEALNKTVETLSKENDRVLEELETVRKEYSECEKARKEFGTIVGQQASEISRLNSAVEGLSLQIQTVGDQLSSP